MRITGPIPSHILKLMPKEDRPKGVAGLTNEECVETQAVKNERELQDNVAALLRQRGIVFNYSRMDRRKTDKVGWPDFTFAINGRACAAECKLPGERPTDVQVSVMLAMIENGWLVRLITSEREMVEFLNTGLEQGKSFKEL